MTASGDGPRVRVRRLPHGQDLPLPQPATPASAGYDLRAAIEATQILEPGEIAKVPTGMALEIPVGWEAQLRPRSGLALRHGVTLINSPGTIDADYRGEVAVLLVNHGGEPFEVKRGDRIAQIVVTRVARVEWIEAAHLSPSARGSGGFGSSGS